MDKERKVTLTETSIVIEFELGHLSWAQIRTIVATAAMNGARMRCLAMSGEHLQICSQQISLVMEACS